MKKKVVKISKMFLCLLAVFSMSMPAMAATAAQPTPWGNGYIYKVANTYDSSISMTVATSDKSLVKGTKIILHADYMGDLVCVDYGTGKYAENYDYSDPTYKALGEIPYAEDQYYSIYCTQDSATLVLPENATYIVVSQSYVGMSEAGIENQIIITKDGTYTLSEDSALVQ